MTDDTYIKEHMEVIGSDGLHVGTVDIVEQYTIKLTKTDPSAQGAHHEIPIIWVGEIEGNTVRLTQTAEEARRQWIPDESETESGTSGKSNTVPSG